ncbi:unnamed protein product [Colias eurytheme]|nr:unnamed protein product [Colias eurytheme]
MLFKIILVCAAFVVCNGCVAQSVEPSIERQGTLNVYLAYTRNNPREPEIFNSTLESIAETSLNSTRNTTIIVHGHEGTAYTSINPTVKDALLTNEDVNVIVVDWSQYSLQSYSNAVSAVPSVGTSLAEVIEQLVQANIATLDTIHMVGFDLGAHVVGYAGRSLGGEVARITGLDPAGNQWGSNSQRLNKADAKYVEVIHSDTGGMFPNGIGTPLGHADFYPNGGDSQPGCFLNRPCCHNRAWEYFAASLAYTHLQGNQCSSLSQMAFNRCRGFLYPMGTNSLVKLGSGIYRLNTRGTYPFYLTWY